MDIQRWDRAKEKVGNTFELTVLIQKRVRELVKDRQKPLVDLEHRNPIQVALEEVLQDKIYLAPPPTPVQESAKVASLSLDATIPVSAADPKAAAIQDPTAAPDLGGEKPTGLLIDIESSLDEDDETTTTKRRAKTVETKGEVKGSTVASD